MKRSRSFILVAAVLGAALALPLAARLAGVAQANPAGGGSYYIPFVVRPEPTPTPPVTAPAGIANPSFENENWFTDYGNGGNQHPVGWAYFAPAKDQPMLWPTKGQEGATVPATSTGPGENVHLYWHQIPEEIVLKFLYW